MARRRKEEEQGGDESSSGKGEQGGGRREEKVRGREKQLSSNHLTYLIAMNNKCAGFAVGEASSSTMWLRACVSVSRCGRV